MEEFSCGTRILHGSGILRALGTLGATRVLVVAGEGEVAAGTARRAAEAAGCVAAEIFPVTELRPSVALASAGAARARAFRPDWIVALGDGGVIDCAKAVAFLCKDGCRLAAVPTTAGGAEVTDFASLTYEGERRLLVDPRLRPKVAILDGELLAALPAAAVAEAGFDVLTHSLEAYVSRRAGALSDLHAREAFRSAFAVLPAACAGSAPARQRVQLSATLAGMAVGCCGLGLCHALAHSLEMCFPVAHGRLNAVLLPAVLGCNTITSAGKYAELARSAGFGGSSDTVALRSLQAGLLRLRRELELPETLAQAGVDPRSVWRQAERIVGAALADPCCRDNPLPPEDFLIRRILEEVTGRF